MFYYLQAGIRRFASRHAVRVQEKCLLWPRYSSMTGASTRGNRQYVRRPADLDGLSCEGRLPPQKWLAASLN